MAILLNAQRIRFAIDASKPFAALTDSITGAAIALPSGSALQFEMQFYFGPPADANLLDLTQYSAITVQLQSNNDPHSGTVYYTGSVAAANFSLVNTAAWTAANSTAQMALLAISSAANVVPPAGTNYWICIYGVSTDGAGDLVLLAATNITGKDSGVPNANPGLPQNLKLGPKISFACGDGSTRDVSIKQGPNGRWTLDVNQAGYNGIGQAIYSLYCSDGEYRDLSLQLVEGFWTIDVNQNGHS